MTDGRKKTRAALRDGSMRQLCTSCFRCVMLVFFAFNHAHSQPCPWAARPESDSALPKSARCSRTQASKQPNDQRRWLLGLCIGGMAESGAPHSHQHAKGGGRGGAGSGRPRGLWRAPIPMPREAGVAVLAAEEAAEGAEAMVPSSPLSDNRRVRLVVGVRGRLAVRQNKAFFPPHAPPLYLPSHSTGRT